jgi:hypothetical protein
MVIWNLVNNVQKYVQYKYMYVMVWIYNWLIFDKPVRFFSNQFTINVRILIQNTCIDMYNMCCLCPYCLNTSLDLIRYI